jgi:acyl-CoA synthetase (AMP-forming)/AMP-acid ligase II
MRLHDVFDFHARETPDADFAVYRGERTSYGEARAAIHRIAHALMDAGLEPGDRAAFLAKNCLESVYFFYAASKVGVVPVPLNYRLAGPEWAYIVNDSEARLLVARGELALAIEAIRGEIPKVERFVGLAAEMPGWTSWQEWQGDRPTHAPGRSVADDADLYQMYTSGTTGRPKGAVLTHRAVTTNLSQIGSMVQLRSGDRYLIVAPLYHAAAAVAAFWTVQQGGALYIQEEFDPREVVRTLAEDRIAAATLVPAMIQACLVAAPEAGERRYDDLRFVLYGASPIAEETLRHAMQVFACDFVQGYGMTETTAGLTFLLPRDHARALREKPELLVSAGRAIPGTEVRIVDEDDEPVPTGEIGEVVARGPQLMRGYWNLPDATREALRGGWMHTGDAGRLDDEGYLYIQDRVKDMIVSGGENVYPREVEDVLFEHPSVADAAVIGVPHAQWGEGVKAIVVLRPGARASADEILEFCRGRLAGYKRPGSVDFVDALPRNPSGKVLKRELREPWWKGRTRRVAGS